MSRTEIYCEGCFDQKFWSGMLKRQGCKPPQNRAMKSAPSEVRDPDGQVVKKGHFLFISPSGGIIRIIGCDGKPNVVPAVNQRLRTFETETHPANRVIVNLDSDQHADGQKRVESIITSQSLQSQLRPLDPTATLDSDGTISAKEGRLSIHLVDWSTDDEATDWLPNQQTIERLICSALFSVYPNRGPQVSAWLKSRENPPVVSAKEYAWSYMAGWHSEKGCSTFYECLWDDEMVALALQSRLAKSNIWPIVESLTR